MKATTDISQKGGTGTGQQEVNLSKEQQPGTQVTVSVSSKQNLATGTASKKFDENEDLDEDEDKVEEEPSKKSKKKKKKKKKESSSESEDEEKDGADRANSKKKTSAAVLTKINIFTSSPGSPSVGIDTAQAGPKLFASMTGPVSPPPIVQAPIAAKESRRGGKGSRTTAAPGGMDAQTVILIPMPPGMAPPAFSSTGASSVQQQMEEYFAASFPATDMSGKKRKKRKGKDKGQLGLEKREGGIQGMQQGASLTPGSAAGNEVPGWGYGEQRAKATEEADFVENQEPMEGSVTPVGTPEAAAEVPQKEEASQLPPKSSLDMSSEENSNNMVIIIVCTLIAVIVIAAIVIFAITWSNTETSPPMNKEMSLMPSPPFMEEVEPVGSRKTVMKRLRRFKKPLEAYWNLPEGH